jgi:hypothetical protein
MCSVLSLRKCLSRDHLHKDRRARKETTTKQEERDHNGPDGIFDLIADLPADAVCDLTGNTFKEIHFFS